MEIIIFYIAFFLITFHISGLATTNILRLTRGNTRPVLDSKCSCDKCGHSIPPLLQLPIVSYIACKGKCRNCKTQIAVFPLVLELMILIGMFLLQSLFGFSLLGVTLSFVYYELVRVAVILKEGKRETAFAKQYVVAVLAMIPFYAMTIFVSLLYQTVCTG